jgi:hypothetical protein
LLQRGIERQLIQEILGSLYERLEEVEKAEGNHSTAASDPLISSRIRISLRTAALIKRSSCVNSISPALLNSFPTALFSSAKMPP